jgi:hypothetical protein
VVGTCRNCAAFKILCEIWFYHLLAACQKSLRKLAAMFKNIRWTWPRKKCGSTCVSIADVVKKTVKGRSNQDMMPKPQKLIKQNTSFAV